MNVKKWPYYAPNPLCGGAAKGARGGRVGSGLRLGGGG